MIVIADTGPLNYLVLIGEVDVLPHLYTRVIVPEAVVKELRAAGAPASVRTWIARPRHGSKRSLTRHPIPPLLSSIRAKVQPLPWPSC
jgi:predicted nucleic acid-binding protein